MLGTDKLGMMLRQLWDGHKNTDVGQRMYNRSCIVGINSRTLLYSMVIIVDN